MSNHPIQVNSVEDLLLILDRFGIDYGKWNKTPQDLFGEIENLETTLTSDVHWGKLTRNVQSVFLTVISPDGTMQLVEDHQEYADGKIVVRGLIEIAEKCKADENPIAVAYRAIREELLNGESFDTSSIELVPIPNPETNKVPRSAYEGLNTVNNITRFKVQLTDELFKPEGYKEVQPGKKITYFPWKPISEIHVD